MGPGEKPRKSLQEFAADQIGLGELGDSADTMARLFRKLRDDDFLPDPMTHESILILAGRPISRDSLLLQEANQLLDRRLHDEVERFAAGFFAIPVSLRVARWKVLVQTCSGKAGLIERLQSLKPGLTIDAQAVTDPSPAVRQILDDILDLFPLRPSIRAARSRAKIERFRTDLNAPARAKALKQVYKKHITIAELLPGYLSDVAWPVRASRLQGFVPRLSRRVRSKVRERPVLYFMMALGLTFYCITAGLTGLSSWNDKSRPSSPSSRSSGTVSQKPSPPVSPSVVPNLDPARMKAAIRTELKVNIRREVSRIGKQIDDTQLEVVTAGLPVDELPNVGGLGMVVILGHWTEAIHARFSAALKEGLRQTDLKFTEAEIDGLVVKCLPGPTSQPAPSRSPTP